MTMQMHGYLFKYYKIEGYILVEPSAFKSKFIPLNKIVV
jgi:hypothetical protein